MRRPCARRRRHPSGNTMTMMHQVTRRVAYARETVGRLDIHQHRACALHSVMLARGWEKRGARNGGAAAVEMVRMRCCGGTRSAVEVVGTAKRGSRRRTAAGLPRLSNTAPGRAASRSDPRENGDQVLKIASGRTSIDPLRAVGMRAAIARASSRSAASTI